RPLALPSTVLQPPPAARALRAVNRARCWDEFRAACSQWATPAMNLLYADSEGNIGYQMVGQIPVRGRGEGLVPSPGWSGQYEWRSAPLPFEEMPTAFNPPDGLWANANHNPAKRS